MHLLRPTWYFMNIYMLILYYRECSFLTSTKKIHESLWHIINLFENELKLLCINNSLALAFVNYENKEKHKKRGLNCVLIKFKKISQKSSD